MNKQQVSKLCMVMAVVASSTEFGLDEAIAAQRSRADVEEGGQVLTRAIRAVESQGRDGAVGDEGRAIGSYQIHYAYWKDSGVLGRWEQCRDRQYAERVVRAYWQRYCPKALATGDSKTLARVHHGGPSGPLNPKTLGYWRKVHSAIRAESNDESKGTQGV